MSQVRCPYCGSVQVKAMSNQPKKYPRPTDPIDLANWQKGYDCKKCGNDFIVQPPKPASVLSIITRIAFWLIVVACAIAFFTKDNKDSVTIKEPDSIEKIINETESQNSDLKFNEGDPTPVAIEPTPNQEFSKEAEEAAHEYIPTEEDYKKLEQTQKVHKSDNLTIVETTRDSEE